MRGRKPKPTQLKVLEGKPGHRPLNKREPKLNVPKNGPPKWFTPRALEEWNRIYDHLIDAGLLTTGDRTTFALYCQAYADAVDSRIEGGICKAWFDSISKFTRLAVELGLTPSSRSRIISAKPDSPAAQKEQAHFG